MENPNAGTDQFTGGTHELTRPAPRHDIIHRFKTAAYWYTAVVLKPWYVYYVWSLGEWIIVGQTGGGIKWY